jgi:hypothetical protein
MIFLQMDFSKVDFNKEEIENVKRIKFENLQSLINDCKINSFNYTPWFLPSLLKVKKFVENKLI